MKLYELTRARLSVILGRILREFYSLKRPSAEDQIHIALQITQQLEKWKKESSILLNPSGSLRSLLRPLFQRQKDVLTLAYWHAILLLHRPFLLGNFTSLANYSTPGSNSSNNDPLQSMIQNCLDAAMEISRILEELESHNQLYRAFWVRYRRIIAPRKPLTVFSSRSTMHAVPWWYCTFRVCNSATNPWRPTCPTIALPSRANIVSSAMRRMEP